MHISFYEIISSWDLERTMVNVHEKYRASQTLCTEM